jgi:zinc transport system substrate-binding protein
VVFVGIPPQRFVVEQLVGPKVQVEVLLPPGASPATYEPTPRQMAALDGADLYLQIGAPFEAPILTRMRSLMPDLRVVDCRDGVTLEPMEPGSHGHAHGPLDPHIWLDPLRMMSIARTTASSLQELFPEDGDRIAEALRRLQHSIEATHLRVEAVLRPHAGRRVLVFHPAYGYFTRRYGLVQKAIESEGKAPSTRQLAEIVGELQKEKTPAIFVQPQFSRSTARRMADALECRLVELDPLAEDYLVNLEAMARRIADSLE